MGKGNLRLHKGNAGCQEGIGSAGKQYKMMAGDRGFQHVLKQETKQFFQMKQQGRSIKTNSRKRKGEELKKTIEGCLAG